MLFQDWLESLCDKMDEYSVEIEQDPKKWREPGPLALIASIRAIAEAFPVDTRAYFQKDDKVKQWASVFDEWFDQARLPKKYREGIRATATDEFSRIIAVLSWDEDPE